MSMSQPNTHLSLPLIIFLTLLPLLPALPVLPDPDPATIQTFLPSPSTPPATIPAFPEQSDLAGGCPLSLPKDLFQSVKSACGSTKSKSGSTHIHRTRCCPVLAAWLYSAYSSTALGRSLRGAPTQNTTTPSYDLPLLPDDSETCVDTLQKELDRKGVELIRPNETCDVVYCYCGIRLHPLTCPEAFSVNGNGELTGDNSVRKLERDCLSNGVNGFPGLGGCSKCLNSLYLLNRGKSGNSTKSEERTRKMQNKDCELMGLTWLLAKNRSAYIHTVTAVLRAMMMSTAGTDPRSCSLNSDGMPLAVDSSEINDSSSSNVLQSSLFLFILSIFLLYISVSVSLRQLLTMV